MSTHSPSHKQTTPRRRRDGLIWLILLALLLALVPIGCIAELALRLVVPANDPFKDVGSSSSLNAYAPFPGGISYAAVDPYAPNIRATEVSRRERLTPVALRGAVTVAPVAEVGPPVSQFVPPTPTLTTQPTPRPTITPGPPLPPPAAGGAQPSPTATELVLIPGVTATPAPSSTPTRTPTRGPTGEPSATATRQPAQPTATSAPIVAGPTPAPPPPTNT
ncbi:MAG TPA: hypothetical protein PKD53_30425, partial [Chloroflexaceae bacterium]|nr:hypothetical protein [Chloroflexaceae bacterium]